MGLTKDDKKHYWIISMDNYDIDWGELATKDICEVFAEGVEKNIKYISVVNKNGENIYQTEGHSTENLEDEPWIEVFDEEGNLDIEETANVITKDFLSNRAIIAMRFEADLYDELGKDKSWIDNILDGDDE